MFESVDQAKRAKQALNGADIYSGCCTLKIEYAKVSFQALNSVLEIIFTVDMDLSTISVNLNLLACEN